MGRGGEGNIRVEEIWTISNAATIVSFTAKMITGVSFSNLGYGLALSHAVNGALGKGWAVIFFVKRFFISYLK